MGLLEQWEAAKRAGRGLLNPQTALDFARGGLMSGTTDLLGYPVDVATMALRPMGYNVEKPIGGSDWLAGKLTSPTGSKAEMAGRVAGGLLTPGPEDVMRMTGLLAPKPGPMQELITYHGSPHRINNVDADNPMGKFDLSKVGTGEGAQAYGHGVYLAEAPETARTYQGLAGDDLFVEGQKLGTIGALREAADPDLATAAAQIRRYLPDDRDVVSELDTKLALRDYLKVMKNNPGLFPQRTIDGVSARFKELAGKTITKKSGGHFYTVDLPDEHIAKMLDWDAPLSEQPESVRAAAKAFGVPEFVSEDDIYKRAIAQGLPDAHARDWAKEYAANNAHGMTGEMLYRAIAKKYSSAWAERNNSYPAGDFQKEASQELAKFGIPGIKYFDGGSRAAGEGTRNFVIFDGDTAKILKRE